MAEEKKADLFESVEELPPDAIFHVKTRYKQDTYEKKVNVGIGAYRDDNGKPWVLPIVRKVEKELANDESVNKEYLAIPGDSEFVLAAQKLILGKDNKVFNEKRVEGVQCLSGTGGLRVLFEFIRVNFGDKTKIFLSNPTWGNHKKIIKRAGLSFDTYTYWDQKNRNLNLKEMLNDLDKKSNSGDVVLLHACAHNPTGVDPTKKQWQEIADFMCKKKLIPYFDCAYQGFATGNLDNDAYSVRLFVEKGLSLLISQSFAKNLGLYCERIGCASVVTQSSKSAKACKTQLNAVVRPMYSNPPAHGARIVKRILNNEKNFNEWKQQMNIMSQRIKDMRTSLRKTIESQNTPGTWNHITDQIGMFTFTGLTPEQCDQMEKKWHIYMLRNGRISMAGVCSKNVQYIGKAIDDVVRTIKK